MRIEERGADDKTEFIRHFCFLWGLGSTLMRLLGSGREKREENKTGFAGAD